jgi:hypothetical protein
MGKAQDLLSMSEMGREIFAGAAKQAEVEISKALHRGLGGNTRIKAMPGQGFPLVYIIEVGDIPQTMKVTIEPHSGQRRR